MIAADSSPWRKVNSARSRHCRRVSATAPETAFAKLSCTIPRGVVGSVTAAVLGSISPLSFFTAAWVTRPWHSATPTTSSLGT